MNFAVFRLLRRQVVRHVFGQQMAAVAGRIDQHIGAGGADRAVQNRFHGFVAGLALFKAQVITVNDEFLGSLAHDFHNVGQVGQIGLVDFDQAQALVSISVQAGANQRGLAGAACAGQQHVVGRAALYELLGVAGNLFLLHIDVLQIGQLHGADMAHRLQHAAAVGALAVAPGNGGVPVSRRLQGLGQNGFNALHQLLGAQHQLGQWRGNGAQGDVGIGGRCHGKLACLFLVSIILIAA